MQPSEVSQVSITAGGHVKLFTLVSLDRNKTEVKLPTTYQSRWLRIGLGFSCCSVLFHASCWHQHSLQLIKKVKLAQRQFSPLQPENKTSVTWYQSSVATLITAQSFFWLSLYEYWKTAFDSSCAISTIKCSKKMHLHISKI